MLFAGCGSGGGERGLASDPGSGGGPGAPGEPGVPLGWTPEFQVTNFATSERTETLLASVPFPFGHHTSTGSLVVAGHQTAWRVLQRWRDGSIRVAQAQFTDALAAGQTKTYSVAGGTPSLGGSFTRNTWVTTVLPTLQIGAEVRDAFNVAYRSFTSGTGEVLAETPLQRVARHRTYHTATSGGIGHDSLTSTFYVQEFRDVPVVVVDWVLGNDYLGSDAPNGSSDRNLYPLGGVDVDEARFLCGGQGVTALPFRPTQNAIDAGASVGGGLTGFRVLNQDWLGDGQTPPGPASCCRWCRRVPARPKRPAGSRPRKRWSARRAIRWRPTTAGSPPAASACSAAPIEGPADAWARAEGEYQTFWGSSFFGTFGSRGDPLPTGTTGTPRNGPLSQELAHAVQAGHQRLVGVLEEKAWIQALRVPPLVSRWGTDGTYFPSPMASRCSQAPAGTSAHESLGRRAIVNNDPHPAYRTRI